VISPLNLRVSPRFSAPGIQTDARNSVPLSLFSGSGDTYDEPEEKYRGAPGFSVIRLALNDIRYKLHPPRDTGNGYKDPHLDQLLQSRLEHMKSFMCIYLC